MTVLVSLTLAVLAASARPADSGPPARLHVLVRFERHAAIDDRLMAAMAGDVHKIWRPYGVDVSFVLSGAPAPGVYDEELRLVITDSLPAKGRLDPAGLGWIDFVAPGRPAPTITVSTAVAANLMPYVTWAGARIGDLPDAIRQRFLHHALSRAAAHELGHYLLRSALHGRTGLMRQRFTVVEIMDNSLAPYGLEPREVQGLEWRRAEGTDVTPGWPKDPVVDIAAGVS